MLLAPIVTLFVVYWLAVIVPDAVTLVVFTLSCVSRYAVPSTYKSFHCKFEEPKFLWLFRTGVKLSPTLITWLTCPIKVVAEIVVPSTLPKDAVEAKLELILLEAVTLPVNICMSLLELPSIEVPFEVIRPTVKRSWICASSVE